jgi:hypothetical protein
MRWRLAFETVSDRPHESDHGSRFAVWADPTPDAG